MTPVGGRVTYALLGGHFETNRSSVLDVSIYATNGAGKPFDDALVKPFDEVRVGLPSEYVDGVKQGIQDAVDSRSVGSGRLVVNCAAHAAAGSSIVAFRGVARSLVCLFNAADDDLDLRSIF